MRRFTPLAITTLFTALSAGGCAEDNLAAGALLADQPSTDSAAVHAVCPDGEVTFGIDVSYYQGTIDWNAVAADGVKFAIIRVSDGTGFYDPKFQQNWAGAKAAGIIRGVYQFFRSDDDPIAQANLLLSEMGPLDPGDLPPVADMESTDGVGNATRADRLRTWLNHVESATGRRPIIYTGGYYWQDHVGQDFSDYPLWHAGYTGGTCPSTLANQWPDWHFWQFTSSGSVAGISGNVDQNHFNGSLAQLQAFAQSNTPPRGYLDAVGCDAAGAVGWAQDPDARDSVISVHLYVDGEAGSGAAGFSLDAGNHRDDLCAAIGSCAHGFSFPLPNAYRNGQPHTVFAYGIDSAGGNNPLLIGSGASVTCAAPAVPLAPDEGVLRHVTSPDVMTAWSFAFSAVTPYSDAALVDYVRADPWSATPRLVRAHDNFAVYVVDTDGARRHVINPDSFAAWGFDGLTIEALEPSVVDAMPLGIPLPATPILLRGEGPAVYVLDTAPSAEGEGEGEGQEGEGEEGEGEEGEGETGDGEGDGTDERFVRADAPPDSCASALGGVWAFVLALLAPRRRRVTSPSRTSAG